MYAAITYEADPLLTVFIDGENRAAGVFFRYDDDEADRPTVFQTADMPMDDQAAARRVNDWLEAQA